MYHEKILIFHPTLYRVGVGSSEDLLISFINYLINKTNCELHIVFEGHSENEFIPNNSDKIFYYEIDNFIQDSSKKNSYYSKFINKVIREKKINFFIGFVWEDYQKHIVSIPLSTKLLLISPFGHFSSNGNLHNILVSGQKNFEHIRQYTKNKRVLFFNPLPIPFFNKGLKDNSTIVLFGRAGRSDPLIFDSISLHAFKKLEIEFGPLVNFIYLNPCNNAIELAKKLNIKNIQFQSWLTKKELSEFYKKIDVFAHSRFDGETLGVAIAEALSYGNCFITHKTQLNNEQLFFANSPYGISVNQNDINGYYNAMRFFVINKKNLFEYGNMAKKFINLHFNEDKILDNVFKDLFKLNIQYYSLNLFFNFIKISVSANYFYIKMKIHHFFNQYFKPYFKLFTK
jgi:hypothetical protein